MQVDAPVKADKQATGEGGKGDYEGECLPMESSDIVYTEVYYLNLRMAHH